MSGLLLIVFFFLFFVWRGLLVSFWFLIWFLFFVLLVAVDFYNQINLLYGSITEFCTNDSCPLMSAGPRYTYAWGEGKKKPVTCSAPVYVENLMTWIQEKLDNENIFPTTEDAEFPPDFLKEVKNIFKRLFRVYAHIYYSHFNQICSFGEEAHLNTCFKHFYYFITHFDLIDERELQPLQTVITNLTQD
eukprot:TRINITY_DN1211_c0_g1_i1.p1 TRINITY_DN1211_c0_g1~~TRINITY_DN1211_c0_g1_i1.p1  ORF type:complete len:189 (+),score=31.99 TRINITY_DN1211_c0_g1_i1:207-773(+)